VQLAITFETCNKRPVKDTNVTVSRKSDRQRVETGRSNTRYLKIYRSVVRIMTSIALVRCWLTALKTKSIFFLFFFVSFRCQVRLLISYNHIICIYVCVCVLCTCILLSRHTPHMRRLRLRTYNIDNLCSTAPI